ATHTPSPDKPTANTPPTEVAKQRGRRAESDKRTRKLEREICWPEHKPSVATTPANKRPRCCEATRAPRPRRERQAYAEVGAGNLLARTQTVCSHYPCKQAHPMLQSNEGAASPPRA